MPPPDPLWPEFGGEQRASGERGVLGPGGPHSPAFSYSASLRRQAVHTPGFMAPSSQQNHPDLCSGHHVPSF